VAQVAAENGVCAKFAGLETARRELAENETLQAVGKHLGANNYFVASVLGTS
jgi:hypothetical protein